jgi:hypothetical protein
VVKFMTTNELIEQLREEDPSGTRRPVVDRRFVESVRQRDGASVELKLGEREYDPKARPLGVFNLPD